MTYIRPRQLHGLGDDPCAGPNPSIICLSTSEAGSTDPSTVTAADFNSTAVPGVCKPINLPAMNAVEELQKQLNRVAAVKGYAKIGIDGAIGTKTLALFRQVQTLSQGLVYASAGLTILGDATRCIYIAADSDVIGGMVQLLADSLKAPSTVAAGVPQTNRTLIPKGGIAEVPRPMGADVLQAWTGLGGTGQLVVLAALGGIGWYVLKGGKKKGRAGSLIRNPLSRAEREEIEEGIELHEQWMPYSLGSRWEERTRASTAAERAAYKKIGHSARGRLKRKRNPRRRRSRR